MKKDTVLEEIQLLIVEGKGILDTKYNMNGWEMVDKAKSVAWKAKIVSFLEKIFDNEDSSIHTIKSLKQNFYVEIQTCINVLKNVYDYIEKGFIDIEEETLVDVELELDRIFSRFHRIARQLRSRHAGRDTLEIEDEYDVQDLLHSLLHLHYDDIRSEEWTPSYAGSSARVDFLLKNEKVVIEVKKTRQGLADKEIGNQLIEDIERYRIHPDCQKLICFVYDPEGRIGNVMGVMNDLNSRHAGFARVVIKPDM